MARKSSTIKKTTPAHEPSSKKKNSPVPRVSPTVSKGVAEAGGILPHKLYEILRWAVWIVLPAIATLISGLNAAWSWNWPIDAILTTFSVVEVFLGTVLGIGKLTHDAPELEDHK